MLNLEIENKVAVITGASDGLGRAAAERLVEEGVKLAICARRGNYLDTSAKAICIGKVKSAQWERRARDGNVAALYAKQGASIPLGRMGEAEEFADLVAFLVSRRAAYITGTAINFDGGLSSVA